MVFRIMEWLNYHHLRYFWAVAREGNLRKAAEELNVSQPSVSAQVNQLEAALGTPLFQRSGRGLVMTDAGKTVFSYAETIFATGRELLSVVRQNALPGAAPFHVGITDTVPKLAVREILRPVAKLDPPVRMICREGKVETLLAQLATHRLDIVLADEPSPSALKFRTFNHPLGSSSISLCASPALAKRLQKGFPKSLQGAPALLPSDNSPMRQMLERWFDANGVRPQVLAEFEDAALMEAFALQMEGFFPVHTIAVNHAIQHFGFKIVGELSDVHGQFYAMTAGRRLKHRAVIALTQHAHTQLFAEHAIEKDR